MEFGYFWGGHWQSRHIFMTTCYWVIVPLMVFVFSGPSFCTVWSASHNEPHLLCLSNEAHLVIVSSSARQHTVYQLHSSLHSLLDGFSVNSCLPQEVQLALVFIRVFFSFFFLKFIVHPVYFHQKHYFGLHSLSKSKVLLLLWVPWQSNMNMFCNVNKIKGRTIVLLNKCIEKVTSAGSSCNLTGHSCSSFCLNQLRKSPVAAYLVSLQGNSHPVWTRPKPFCPFY